MIKLTIAVLSIGYIVFRFYHMSAEQVSILFKDIFANPYFVILATTIFLLMFVNLSMEAYKWKLLMDEEEKVSFLTAYKAILGGLSVSIFTPNRVGEFMGRVFILKKANPVRAILLTIVGSLSQLLTTILFGSLMYMYFAPRYMPLLVGDNKWIIYGSMSALLLLSAIYLFIYFHIHLAVKILKYIPKKYQAKTASYVEALTHCPKSLLIKVLMLSMARYGVFSFQFFLALVLMHVPINILHAYVAMPVIYLALAGIPTIALSEIGVRGSVSDKVFGLVLTSTGTLTAAQSLSVISASTLIWTINIALPALTGVFIIFRLKFFKK